MGKKWNKDKAKKCLSISLGTVLFFGLIFLGGEVLGLFKSLEGSEEASDITPHLLGINPDQVDWKAKGKEYWKKTLGPERYKVTRAKGTERPFTGRYNDYKGTGVFTCSNCGLSLFSAKTKFDSKTGWPSFTSPFNQKNIKEVPDNSLFMKRTEVICSRCGAHLGHVFKDGPPPTGLRYCINSVALNLKPSTPPKTLK